MDDPFGTESAFNSIEKTSFSVAEGWRGDTYHHTLSSRGQECYAVLLFNLPYSHPMILGYTYNYSHRGTSISQPCLSPNSIQSITNRSEMPPSLSTPSIPPSEIQPLLPPFRPTRHGTRPSPTSLLSTASTTSRSATRSGRSRRPTGRSGGRRNRPRRRWR
jgi:hypothetical protein